jgi:hypothetical protein
MAKVASRNLQKEAAWRRRLRQQAKSGQSIRAWCGEHRVTETAFYWWRRELARRDAEGGAAAFVPVCVAEEPARDGDRGGGDQRGGDALIEIVLTDGRRVRVAGRVDQEMLTAVLEALAMADAVVAERRAC